MEEVVKESADKYSFFITLTAGIATLGLGILGAYLFPNVPGAPKPESLYERKVEEDTYLIRQKGSNYRIYEKQDDRYIEVTLKKELLEKLGL